MIKRTKPMENDNTEEVYSKIDTEVTENTEIEEESAEESSEVSEVEELKKRIKTLEFKRAHDKKKMEEYESEHSKTQVNTNNSSMSMADMLFIKNSNLESPEDLAIAEQFARVEGVSLAKALQSDIVKIAIERKAEQRKTASMSYTGTAKKAAYRVSDDVLFENAMSNKAIPETDEDIRRLINKRLQGSR
jgi:hypothetical protein